jgi:hypothetical protein
MQRIGSRGRSRRWLIAVTTVVLLGGCGADDTAKPNGAGVGTLNPTATVVSEVAAATTLTPSTVRAAPPATTAATQPATTQAPATVPLPTQPPATNPQATSAPAKANSAKASAGGGSCQGGYINVDGNCISSPRKAPSAPAGATAQCRDGTYSFSRHRQGTCSGHGGVAQWL